jgi:hypothetical protein
MYNSHLSLNDSSMNHILNTVREITAFWVVTSHKLEEEELASCLKMEAAGYSGTMHF